LLRAPPHRARRITTIGVPRHLTPPPASGSVGRFTSPRRGTPRLRGWLRCDSRRGGPQTTSQLEPVVRVPQPRYRLFPFLG
jgi:hypothetical protein